MSIETTSAIIQMGEQAEGLQIHEVQQREGLVFDRKLFGQWLGELDKRENCLQLNVLLRQYLDSELETTAEIDESDEESGSEGDVDDAGLSKAWAFVRRAVSQHMSQERVGMGGGHRGEVRKRE